MRLRLAAAGIAVALVAALLAGAGCGDENSEAEGTGKTFSVQASTTVTTGDLPTKARFIARVNQICRFGWKVILENFSEYSSWQDPKLSDRQVYTQSVRLSYLAGVDFHIFDEIYNLGAPAGEERAVEDVIGEMQIAVEKGQRVVPVHNDEELVALFADYNDAARAYGLSDCLIGGSHLPRISPLA